MDTANWIPIYMVFIIIFAIVIPQQRATRHFATIKLRKKRGIAGMTNEILKKFIGKSCYISTGTFGTNIVGVIEDINENWLEVRTKKNIQLINAEFVQSIKVVER